jgi:hypothetical protein
MAGARISEVGAALVPLGVREYLMYGYRSIDLLNRYKFCEAVECNFVFL